MSDRAKTLTKAAILLMSFGTIFGFRNIVSNQLNFGLLAAVLFLIGGAIYAIPLVLITSEFGSIKKLKNQESGLGSFCVFTLGKKYGFLASWASYFGNLFFFATIAPFTIIALSFLFLGSNGFDQLAGIFSEKSLSESGATRASACILALFAIVLFWGGTFVSRKGPKWIGIFTNIGGSASLLLGVLFIVIALVYTIPFHGIIDSFGPEMLDPINDDVNGFGGDWWSFISAFPWLIFAYNGIETMSVFIKDTKGGAKAFKLASTLGMIVVIVLMVIGTLVLSMTINQSTINEWGLSNSYYYVFPEILGLDHNIGFGKALVHIIGLVTALNGMGSMFFWTAGPAKVFFSEIPENVMGKYISKIDNNGIPKNALFLQAIVVSAILIIVGVTTSGEITTNSDGVIVGSGSSVFLTKITQATTSLATVQMFFYFIGYIKFRLKNDNEERDSRFFKNKWYAISICIVTLILLAIAFFFGTIPSPQSWANDWSNSLIDFLFIFGGFIFFMGFGIFMWWFNIERKNKINKKNKKL